MELKWWLELACFDSEVLLTVLDLRMFFLFVFCSALGGCFFFRNVELREVVKSVMM